MNRLVLVRHGISIGNEKGIIQGKIDFPLSDLGKKELNNLDFSKLNMVTNIYSSNFKRAMETAEIIKSKIGFDKDIIINENLREVSAGILDGKTKNYCQKNFSKEYEIYLKRGDYNDILNADKWQENQARAILFLSKYFSSDNNFDIVVSHAAFIRCMYNLLLYRDRNTQLNIENGSMLECINPTGNLSIINFPIAKSSIVNMIETFDNKYIVKLKNSSLSEIDYFEYELLKYLKNYLTVPEILKMSNIEEGQIKVMQYLNGIHKFGTLTQKETINIFETIFKLNMILKNYDTDSKKGDIKKDLIKIKNRLYNTEAKKELELLLTDIKFNNYLLNSEYILVHNDLHRSNLLIDNNQINILDFENIQKYPKELQLATLICSCFLLENSDYNYENLIKYWPGKEEIDLDILKKLIKYRILYGMSFFENRIQTEKVESDDLEIHKKYIKALEGIKNE